MLSRGGFCLPKFTPNCISVLSKAPSERKSTPELNLDPNELPLESAFVVLWFVETDELGFKIRDLNRPETKRDILPSTCSAYDLLGFAASKTIKSSCAVDMYKMLMEKMDLPIKCTKQWTDNEIVLHYIKKCKMSLSDQHCQLCRRHKRELSEGSVESHARIPHSSWRCFEWLDYLRAKLKLLMATRSEFLCWPESHWPNDVLRNIPLEEFGLKLPCCPTFSQV